MTLFARAPGKVNLCLLLGPVRADGRHEVVTLIESVSLADELSLAPAGGDEDEVVCPGVDGPNLVALALEGLRARGWDAPPVRVTVRKQVPIAAGMGGGSADAAAVLRLAAAVGAGPAGEAVAPGRAGETVAAGPDGAAVAELAASLGSDVPSQLRPGLFIGTGAGDLVDFVEPVAPHALVVVPQPFGLSTADVYREADRLGLTRSADDLARVGRGLRSALRPGAKLPAELLVNDLGSAALSLRSEIGAALDAVRDAGAEHAMVSGSGPTVFGLYWGVDAEARAAAGAAALTDRYPGASPAGPVTEEFGDPGGMSTLLSGTIPYRP